MDFKADVRQFYKYNLSDKQLSLFETYYYKMIEYNKHTNLTTITEKDDAYYKHFFDSLTLMPYINGNEYLCDMGSGAGFPSLPLKIVYPELKITIIDSSNKRISFLKELIEDLNLTNVELIHDRIEVYGEKNKNKFDIVTARALGRLNLISEMALPMLKVGGNFLVMKGSSGKEELKESKNALKVLKASVTLTNRFLLPHNYGERHLYIIRKNQHVKGFPRKYPQMLRKPL